MGFSSRNRPRRAASFSLSIFAAAIVIAGGRPEANAQSPRIGSRLQRMMGQGQSQPDDVLQQPRAPAPPEVDGLDPWLRRFHDLSPQSAEMCHELNAAALREAASAVEQWVVLWGRIAAGQPPQEQLAIVGRLVNAQQTMDREFDNLLAIRTRFASLPPTQERHDALRGYLRAASIMIDLDGRLRHAMIDTIDTVAGRFSQRLDLRERLIELLLENRSSIGAQVMSVELFDDADDETSKPIVRSEPVANPQDLQGTMRGPRRLAMARMQQLQQIQQMQQQSPAESQQTPHLTTAQKEKLIELIASSGNIRMLDDLADFVLDKSTPPTLVLAGADAIRKLGLPQDPRPEQEKDNSLPKPAITALKLRNRLAQIEPQQWSPSQRAAVNSLMTWLSSRAEHGLEGKVYRVGRFDIQPGDWLLMRNPSPYNLFTDLSPGMFTHVGVVTLETGSDGKRRMVIVDLPEKGAAMPATNVDQFLDRTLNYVFVRHPDSAVSRKMGEAAAALIGNPTQFDLNFRTDRITTLQGKLVKGQKIHTYCAGFLLLCAQETNLPREQFFPVTETTAGGHTKENLERLGLSLGDGFVSPTGALFSPQLEIVGRSEPMYDPMREIEEAVYDHFAEGLEDKELRPSPDLFQALRLNVAEASKNNLLLAKALAATAGVSEETDLVAAAKAAAVVETLDSIAYGASGEFQAARRSIMDGARVLDENAHLTSQEREAMQKYRSRHADLAARWDAQRLSPRDLRIELVQYYRDLGCRELDERFFTADRK